MKFLNKEKSRKRELQNPKERAAESERKREKKGTREKGGAVCAIRKSAAIKGMRRKDALSNGEG